MRLLVFVPTIFPKTSIKVLPPILYVLLYYVFGYRRKVVKQNLLRCFKEEEIQTIEKQYYRHLCKVIVEPLVTPGLKKAYFKERMVLKNDLLEKLLDQGKNVFIVMGHMGNWEWLATCAPLLTKYDAVCVYKKLSNPYMEKWVNRSRAKFGSTLAEMNKLPRIALEKAKAGKPFVISFIADQIPSHDNCAVVNFFNEPMYFFDGYEKLAKKNKACLVYAHSKIVKNQYQYECELINDFALNPIYDESAKKFSELLEKNIKKQPYNWLWSHKRWKRMPN